MNKTFKRFLTLLFLIIFLILYLLNSTIIPTSIIDYSIIFFKRLFPVSFIFFIFSSLLIDYGLIELLSSFFKLNSTKFYIFTMSLISGFPSGAKYIEELLSKEMITKEEANNYITFAHFPNPLFVLGTVASCTSKNIATKILLSIIISNFIISLIFNQKEKNTYKYSYTPPINFSSSLTKAITSSIKTITLIYGTSLFFYLLATILLKYLTLTPLYYVLVNGFFDLTKGITATTLINNKLTRAYLILLFISFGGISIHMQVKSIINKKISYKYFLLGRILATIIAIITFSLII